MPVQGNAAFAKVFSIHQSLQWGERCTAVGLGGNLGVSDRTIRRTIELMRDRLDAPIEWEPSTKTYFYSRPWKNLEGVTVNTAEALALILAEQCFRGLRGSPIAPPPGTPCSIKWRTTRAITSATRGRALHRPFTPPRRTVPPPANRSISPSWPTPSASGPWCGFNTPKISQKIHRTRQSCPNQLRRHSHRHIRTLSQNPFIPGPQLQSPFPRKPDI